MIERLETSLKVKSFVSFCNTFCFSLCFLFVPQKKIYIIKINKMLYMIEAMSFKCLSDVFWPVLPRDVFPDPIKGL